MTISPRNFTSFDAFADAMAHDAIKGLPMPHVGDDHASAQRKRAAVRDAMDAAEDRAMDIWAYHVECCEEDFERGIGPAWE